MLDFLPENNFNQHLAKKHLIEDLEKWLSIADSYGDYNYLLDKVEHEARPFILKFFRIDINDESVKELIKNEIKNLTAESL